MDIVVGLDNDKIIEIIGRNKQDLEFSPGTKYRYSNSNYNVLAKIIEKVMDKILPIIPKIFFIDLNMVETHLSSDIWVSFQIDINPYSDWGSGEWWETPTVTKTSGEGFFIPH